MEIRTSRFGTLDVPRDLVIHLAGGLLGFPESEEFVVLEHDAEGSPFKWLQSVDTPSLAFIIVDPHHLVSDYVLQTERDIRDAIGPFDPGDLSTIAIVTVPRGRPHEMTANLRAPIVVRFSAREGKQIILTNDNLSLNHRIFADAAPLEAALS